MPGVKSTIIDTRYFRCVAYDWAISIHREVELPAEDPIFANPKDAWEYFKKIKRIYIIKDSNVAGKEARFPTYVIAWTEFCRLVKIYATHFPQLADTGVERADLPDPLREEPVH